jgi:glucose-6-phosphate dehydrogenase assembly protein OpcA
MPEEIQIADIEQALKQQREREEAANQIPASLFNLILYCHEPERFAYFQDFVRGIIDKFPCRVIMILGDKDPSHNLLKVSVNNLITTKGDLTVACDQIHIDVTASQMVRVPFIILPHLIADLPIYLFWGQDPTQERDILPYLQPYATKLIYDSVCVDQLPTFSRAILAMMAKSNMTFSDRNWAAISGWRELLARTFDNQEKIFQLHAAKAVRIVYNDSTAEGMRHPEIRALYLQAWLAAQMEWKFLEASQDMQKIIYSNSVHQIQVDLTPRKSSMTTPGTILEVNVETPEILFEIARSDHLPQAVVHISTPQECAMPFSLPLPDAKKSSYFLRELFYKGAGTHYRQALIKIGEMR